MPAWPGSLPTSPLMDAFRFEPVPQSVSTEMDSGPPKRRRRFSVAYGKYHLAFLMTGTQRSAFETFYETTLGGGADVITGFADPRDGGTASFQFAQGGDPDWRPLRGHGTANSRLWYVTMTWDRVA